MPSKRYKQDYLGPDYDPYHDETTALPTHPLHLQIQHLSASNTAKNMTIDNLRSQLSAFQQRRTIVHKVVYVRSEQEVEQERELVERLSEIARLVREVDRYEVVVKGLERQLVVEREGLEEAVEREREGRRRGEVVCEGLLERVRVLEERLGKVGRCEGRLKKLLEALSEFVEAGDE
ncbi:hypothetical protein EKO04_003392 [Ascochyta lentis]|uniref:Uncharacterized protein n=1 Tax=Ascochyta lentis TaxID=205686 RepID=A0A8H7J5J5_9PLEO|nr:hypothetical protein EKO04_003392 [Ascochyta lentis]